MRHKHERRITLVSSKYPDEHWRSLWRRNGVWLRLNTQTTWLQGTHHPQHDTSRQTHRDPAVERMMILTQRCDLNRSRAVRGRGLTGHLHFSASHLRLANVLCWEAVDTWFLCCVMLACFAIPHSRKSLIYALSCLVFTAGGNYNENN